jgi:hypothetical protein
VLRTREPRAAKHLSDLIGKAQLERVRESRAGALVRTSATLVFDGAGHGIRSSWNRRFGDSIDLTGYLVQQDKVVAIRFHPRPKRRHARDLIERVIPALEYRPPFRRSGGSCQEKTPSVPLRNRQPVPELGS